MSTKVDLARHIGETWIYDFPDADVPGVASAVWRIATRENVILYEFSIFNGLSLQPGGVHLEITPSMQNDADLSVDVFYHELSVVRLNSRTEVLYEGSLTLKSSLFSLENPADLLRVRLSGFIQGKALADGTLTNVPPALTLSGTVLGAGILGGGLSIGGAVALSGAMVGKGVLSATLTSTTFSVGDAGPAGSLYEGFTLAYLEDFTQPLEDLVLAPHKPRGKYMTSQTYRPGSRAPQGQLTDQYDSDPFNTGPADSNRGVPLGSDVVRITSGSLVLEAKYGTTLERAKTGRALVSSCMMTDFAISAYPDLADTGDVIVEWSVRRITVNGTAGGPAGGHFDLWTRNSERPYNPVANQDINWENGSMNQVLSGVPLDGDSPGGFTPNPSATDLTNFHLIGWKMNKDHFAGIKAYKDGVLFDTGQFNGNLPNSLTRLLLTMHVVSSEINLTNWSTGASMRLEIDYFRVWNRTAKKRYVPLVTVADVNIDAGASTVITLPSATTIWGEVPTSEVVQQVQVDTNEPGGAVATTYNSFPDGVTYNSSTRELTVAPLGGLSGRMHFAVMAKTPGCTTVPLRFNVNVGPVINLDLLEYVVGTPYSLDVYAACDAGMLVTDGIGCTKVITVTGLPGWATYNPQAYLSGTGLITGTPTNTGTSSITITCTNSVGQVATKTIPLQLQDPLVDAFSTNFTASNANLEDAGLGFTRLDGNAGAAIVQSNKIKIIDATSTGTAYVSPRINFDFPQFVQAAFVTGSNGLIATRVTNSQNFLGLQAGSPGALVRKRIAGTITNVATFTFTIVSGDVLRLEHYVTTIKVLRNGIELTPTSGSLTIGTIPELTSTRQGIIARNGPDTSAYIDDFATGLIGSTRDTVPDAFTFTDVTGSALSTVNTSNSITVSGITAATPISVSGGSYSINGGSFVTATGTVVNGDTVRVRQTSSASNSTATDATLNIGGVTDTFTVTTTAAASQVTPGTVTTYSNVVAASTYTSTGLGAVGASERAIVNIVMRTTTARTITGTPTIGGVAMTLLFSHLTTDSKTLSAWYIGGVGNSGQVSITYSGNVVRCAMALWPVTNIATPTAYATSTATTDPATLTLDCPAGGAIFASAYNAGSGTSYTWTNLTEAFDFFASACFSGAADPMPAAQTARSITADLAGTGSFVSVSGFSIK